MDFSSFKKMYSWGVPGSSRVRCDLGRVVASKAGRLDQGLCRSLQPQTPGHCAGGDRTASPPTILPVARSRHARLHLRV